ncbi:MAG: hypothetical protein R3250_06360, partial [Melioribacteraceae bacterium]|nr:hypothetical protein [Melioribacteraceae bacterium]
MVIILESVPKKVNREVVLWKIADQYSYFLNCLKFDDPIYMAGMKEARTKFVANTHITILVRQLPPRCRGDWRYTSDFVSARALELLKKGTWESGELQYDHMVPKTKNIREICEKV